MSYLLPVIVRYGVPGVCSGVLLTMNDDYYTLSSQDTTKKTSKANPGFWFRCTALLTAMCKWSGKMCLQLQSHG